MVVPIVAAGARVAAGAAARGTASSATGQAGARAVSSGPKPVRNPFPVTRRGDTPVAGRRSAREVSGWEQVKKRRDFKETQRAVEEELERDDLDEEEREALEEEQYRLQVMTQQEAEYAQEAGMSAQGSGSSSKQSHRVGTVAMFFMLAFAVIADGLQFLLQFIPGVGQLIAWMVAFLAGGFFFMWFHMLGVSYFSGKFAPVKIGSMLAGTVIELVPLVNALPALTPTVIAVILASRAEDALRSKSSSLDKKPPVGSMRLGPQRLNRR